METKIYTYCSNFSSTICKNNTTLIDCDFSDKFIELLHSRIVRAVIRNHPALLNVRFDHGLYIRYFRYVVLDLTHDIPTMVRSHDGGKRLDVLVELLTRCSNELASNLCAKIDMIARENNLQLRDIQLAFPETAGGTLTSRNVMELVTQVSFDPLFE